MVNKLKPIITNLIHIFILFLFLTNVINYLQIYKFRIYNALVIFCFYLLGSSNSSSSSASNHEDDENLSKLGLTEYSGPKRKNFMSLESRIHSFATWPSSLHQKPADFAEAGFFYCGKYFLI